MKEVKIQNHTIRTRGQPFIVGEAGINHNGDIEKALSMISLAKKVGLDAIKFQTFKPEEFIVDDKETYTYQSQGKEITESMLEMFKRYEFSREEWFKIKKKCDEEKIIFLSTPQNESDLELLLELKIPAIKVGSDDFTNLPLLKNYASTNLPLILSCGMSNLGEIYHSLATVGSFDGYPTILLLTTSQYPTPPEDVNLLKLKSLSEAFPFIPIGFSDHTIGPLASSLAVSFGACFFEKHFTLEHNLPGPDHWFSEDPQGLEIWINSIKKAHLMMGSQVIKPTRAEEKNKKAFRRFIVALTDIKQGDNFQTSNIGMRRISGGDGLSPSLYDKLLGKKANKDYKKGEIIGF